MPVNPLGYALDLVGNNPANYITNEIHTFTVGEARVFVPSGGPFYRIDFEIRNNVTNAILVPNVDYKIVHPVVQAVLMSGKNVNAGIYVHNTNISSVRINYRIIGGNFADTADNIRQLFLNNPPTNPTLIPWDHVFGAPPQMPPVEHLHDMMDTYGYGNLITVLEQLRVAVLSGDGPAFDAIYRYIELMLNNADYVTENEVLALINNDSSNQVKVYADYAALRAETAFANNSDLLYFAIGKNNRYDGKGRCFVWDISSTTDDDNDIVVKPTIIVTNGNGPGRLHSVLNVERDLRNSLATLGRKIDEDGNILTDLQATFPLETVDLDTVVNSGVYFVKPNCTNKPSGNTQGHLFVEKSDIHVVQHFISTIQDDRNKVAVGDANITVPTAHTFNRVGRLVGGNYVWEDWRGLIDRDTLNIALQSVGRKIDEDFKVRSDLVNGTNNTFNGDLNSLIQPGPWYVAPTSTNMPIGAERGTVDVLQSGIFISQTFSSILQEYDITDVSQTVTNGPDTIRPTVFKRILTLNANLDTVDTVGEWISFADLPTINRALRTLGRKVENDFTITTDYAAIGLSIDGDLNDVRDVGHYWVTPTATNKPAGAFDGYLTVINTNIWYTQIYVSTFHDVDYLNVNSNTAVGAAKVFIRNGYFTPGNPTPWQPWQPIVDLDTINNALLTLGRKIKDDFSINSNLITIIAPIGNGLDLNTITKPGIYPIIADSYNLTPHVNWPLGVQSGILRVEATTITSPREKLYTFQEIITCNDNDEYGDPVGENPFLDGQIKPTVYRRIGEYDTWTNNTSWTSWYKTLDTQDAKRHGLTTTGIAANNTVPALTSGNPTDLDSYTMPGKYWVGTGIVNSAFEWGLLEVELIGGTATEAGEVLQTMRSPLINGKYCQRMRYWDTLFNQHTWTNWITLAKQNGDYTQYFEADYPAVPTPFHVINGAKLATEFAALWTTLKRYGIEEAVFNNYVGNTVNLNTITTPGTYWFNVNQTNRPFDYGILEVLVMGGTITSPNEIHQRAYWNGREAIRYRDGSGSWQPWYYIKTKDLAVEQNLAGVGLNGVTLPGDYYYTITTNNRPSNYGLVTVRRENEDIVYQEAHSSENDKYIRYQYANGSWTPWKKLIDQNSVPNPFIYPNNTSAFPAYLAHYELDVPPRGRVVILLIGAGGGGGGMGGGYGGGVAGTDGEDSVVSIGYVPAMLGGSFTEIVRAPGGKGGSPGAWANGSAYSSGVPGNSGRGVIYNKTLVKLLSNEELYPTSGIYTNQKFKHLFLGDNVSADAGRGGPGTANNAAIGGAGGYGALVYFEFENRSDNTMYIQLHVGVKGTGGYGPHSSGGDGFDGAAVVTY